MLWLLYIPHFLDCFYYMLTLAWQCKKMFSHVSKSHWNWIVRNYFFIYCKKLRKWAEVLAEFYTQMHRKAFVLLPLGGVLQKCWGEFSYPWGEFSKSAGVSSPTLGVSSPKLLGWVLLLLGWVLWGEFSYSWGELVLGGVLLSPQYLLLCKNVIKLLWW